MYGALSAIAQKDIKRMVAYSSIGHMGYILVACAAGTKLALIGAVGQMVSHGLILALLFYLVGIIEAKVGTRDLDVPQRLDESDAGFTHGYFPVSFGRDG